MINNRVYELEERAARGEDLNDSESVQLCEGLLSEIPFFTPVNTIATGSFGIVLHAIDNRMEPPLAVAVKMLPRGGFIRSYKTYLKREIVHTATLRHPAIIPLRSAILTSTHLAITSDLCQGGDLYKYVASRPQCRLLESEARWLFQQLAIGISYCHARGVANRDIKLENLLLDNADAPKPLLRIADFGYSKHEMNSSAKTGVGTTAYMAPEVFMGSLSYDAKAADWWSAGVVLFVLVAGRYPFDPADPQFARSVVTANFNIPASLGLSCECIDLIQMLLQVDPTDRANSDTVLKHPWVLKDLPEGAFQLNKQLLDQVAANVQADSELAIRVDALVDLAEYSGNKEQGIVSIPL